MRRRDFMARTVAAAAVSALLPAHAQQGERPRRIGVILGLAETDAEGRARLDAFLQSLQELGWAEGRNVQILVRYTEGDSDHARTRAIELMAFEPDVILTSGASTVGSVLPTIRNVPLVFVGAADPVGAGFVDSLAQPGGNATGFTSYEYSMSGKWLELLREIAPTVKRVAVLRDPAISAGVGQFGAIQTAASSLGVELHAVNVRDSVEIERSLAAFARAGGGGLIVTTSALVLAHRDLIVSLAAQHRLPAIYYASFWVAGGGLLSYGPDYLDQYRRAAAYVDRILRGEKPASMPVQAPTKYQLAINLKTAKALGIPIPPLLLARADEVVE